MRFNHFISFSSSRSPQAPATGQNRARAVRLGVGLRAGASVGYIHYTKQKTINPF